MVKKKGQLGRLFFDLRAVESFFNAVLTAAFFVFTHNIFNTWLTYSDVRKSHIGYMSLLALPFSLKPLWAGLLDTFKVPFITRYVYQKRAWFLFMLFLSSILIFIISFFNPKNDLISIAIIIFIINFFIATAGIEVDAYRIELAKDSEQSIFTSYTLIGYRIGTLIFSTSTLLFIDYLKRYDSFSDGKSWGFVFRILSIILFFITIFGMFFFKKNEKHISNIQIGMNDNAKNNRNRLINIFYDGFYNPIMDFIKNNDDWILIYFFILIARAPDVIALSMLTPFLKEIGFSLSEVVIVNKTFGFASALIGSFFGGVLSLKLGLKKAMFFGLIVQTISNIFFIFQNNIGHNLSFLYVTMSVESFCSGCTTSLYLGLMSTLSSKSKYKGFQYAIFSSLSYLGFMLVSSVSGKYADITNNWNVYFSTSIALGILPLTIYFIILKRKIYFIPTE